MKKVILSVALIGLLVSCNSNEGHNNEQELDEKGEIIGNTEGTDEKVETVNMNGYDFLMKFLDQKDDFIDELKGKEVTISQIVIYNSTLSELNNEDYLNYMNGFGYNGVKLTKYSDPENGTYTNIVEGNEMMKFTELTEFTLKNSTLSSTESKMNFVNSELDSENSTETFHTMIYLTVNGDNITRNGNFVTIDGGLIGKIVNF